MIRQLGKYTCEGQVPIIVTDNGDTGDGVHHGPWVRYRFEWETDDKSQAVLCTVFDALIDIGYKHEVSP